MYVARSAGGVFIGINGRLSSLLVNGVDDLFASLDLIEGLQIVGNEVVLLPLWLLGFLCSKGVLDLPFLLVKKHLAGFESLHAREYEPFC